MLSINFHLSWGKYLNQILKKIVSSSSLSVFWFKHICQKKMANKTQIILTKIYKNRKFKTIFRVQSPDFF